MSVYFYSALYAETQTLDCLSALLDIVCLGQKDVKFERWALNQTKLLLVLKQTLDLYRLVQIRWY